MFGYKENVLFVEMQHLRRQQKDSVIIYFLMGIEAPAKGSLVNK
jgi:hypothetical protein